MLSLPLISVVTATWGRPRTVVEHAIPAVACQSYPAVEHLIITDGRDQNLNDVLSGLGYTSSGSRRLVNLGRNWTKPFRNDSNGAICRQVGSYLAAGEWITYLDDDNDWDPSHLRDLYELTLPEGSVELVYTAWRHEHGGVSARTPPQVGNVDTSTFMHHWSVLTSGSWLPDGYTCDGLFVERAVAAGYRWAFKPDPTVTVNGPNLGRPEA